MEIPSSHLPNTQSMGVLKPSKTSFLKSMHTSLFNTERSLQQQRSKKKEKKRKKKKREKVEGLATKMKEPVVFDTSSSPSHSSTSFAVNCVSVTSSEVSRPRKKQKTKEMLSIVQGKWPKSQNSLPKIKKHLRDGLLTKNVEFKINEECTSLAISPSGSVIVGGFTDGTIRFFDLGYNKLWSRRATRHQNNDDDNEETEFSDHDETISKEVLGTGNRAKHKLVCSRENQEYGSVASQIHAKGVHTALIMHVDISPDCKFAFGGVMRGSTEMVAIDISKLEKSRQKKSKNEDILDLIDVWKESDAKLRGFGACTRWEKGYRLFCGRGIKNIHIWNFTPPNDSTGTPTWSCIHDTQSNGNTVSFLRFRHLKSGHLQAVSKSDGQKLRLWDLSSESKRPPYRDVPGTEDAIACSGAFSFGGTYNQMNLVHLDAEDALCSRMEIPLPTGDEGGSGRRRDRRRTLKGIVNAVSIGSGSHALIELSDGTILHYDREKTASPLTKLPIDIFEHCTNETEIAMNRKLTMARIGREGMLVFAVSQYNLTSNRGKISFRLLKDDTKNIRKDEFWGFSDNCSSNVISENEIPHVLTPSPLLVTPMSTVKIPNDLSMSTPSFLSWSSPLSHRSAVNSSPDHTTCDTNGSPTTLKKSHRSIVLVNSSNKYESKNRKKSSPEKQESNNNESLQTPSQKKLTSEKGRAIKLTNDNHLSKTIRVSSSSKSWREDISGDTQGKSVMNPNDMKDQVIIQSQERKKTNQLCDVNSKVSDTVTRTDIVKTNKIENEKTDIIKKKTISPVKHGHGEKNDDTMKDRTPKSSHSGTFISSIPKREIMKSKDESKKDTNRNKLILKQKKSKLVDTFEENSERTASTSKEKNKTLSSKTFESVSNVPISKKDTSTKKLYHEVANELYKEKKASSKQKPKIIHANRNDGHTSVQTRPVNPTKMSIESEGQLPKRRPSNDIICSRKRKVNNDVPKKEIKNQPPVPNERAAHDEIATVLCELQRGFKQNKIENQNDTQKKTKLTPVNINTVLRNEKRTYGEPPDIPLSVRDGLQEELKANNTPSIIYGGANRGNDFNSIENHHLREKDILAAKHRASHEIFRSKFLAALHWEAQYRDPNIAEEKDMREDLEEIICDHEDMLEEMLDIQELEASVLLAKHRSESGRRDLTPLQVSFPFPNMFAEIRRSLGFTC